MPPDNIIEEILRNTTISEIQKKIDYFSLISAELNDKEIINEIKNVLLFGNDSIKASVFTSASRDYQKSSQFFRIRSLEKKEITFKIEDFWEAPPERTNYGRFNKPYKPHLYITSGEFQTPKKELNIKENDHYLLIYYTANQTLSLFELGFDSNIPPLLSESSKEKIKLINNFIREYILNTNEGAYKISSVLSNDIADYDRFDGWCYPSAKDNKAVNACIKTSSKHKLTIKNSFVCLSRPDNDSYIAAIGFEEQDIIQLFTYEKNPEQVKIMVQQMFEDNKEVHKDWHQPIQLDDFETVVKII